MKKLLEKLRYMEQYRFDYLIHLISATLGIILVLISPSIYIGLAIFSVVLHTIKVGKIYLENRKG